MLSFCKCTRLRLTFLTFVMACLGLFGAISTYGAENRILDLTGCNKIVISYFPTTFEYIFGAMPIKDYSCMVSSEELKRLNKTKEIVVTDRKDIEAALSRIRRGKYDGAREGLPRIKTSTELRFYRGETLMNELTIYGGNIKTMDDVWYYYYYGYLASLDMLSKELRPFFERALCAKQILELSNYIYKENSDSYVNPESWCNEVSSEVSRELSDIDLVGAKRYGIFNCPSIDICCYAMNPNCKPNSIVEMVVLFESKPGWNQHGGPELFTFDNHEPKGGCVTFNDGTVRFIRTREELNKLNWGN